MMIEQSALILPHWNAPDTVRAVTTTRMSGASTGAFAANNLSYDVGDDPQFVANNWQSVQHSLDFHCLATVKQVHGNRVVSAEEAMIETCEADAIYCDRPGTACAIMTADCLPVILASDTGDQFAVVHCGWRGLATGILTVALSRFRPKSSIHAWIGPGICQQCYQIDKVVYEAFPEHHDYFQSSGDGHWQCHLAGIARHQLEGLAVTDISTATDCTYEQSEQLYSYRRDKMTGRMATLAWLAHDD